MNEEIIKQGYVWFFIRLILTFSFVIIIDLMLIGRLDPYIVTLINIIIVMIFDTIDSIPVRVQLGSISESRSYGKTKQYKVLDKCGDLLSYLLILYIHLWMVPLRPLNLNNYNSDNQSIDVEEQISLIQARDNIFDIIFICLFVYRAIGTILYINTFNSIYMVLFPNLFINCTIVYIAFTHIWSVSNTWLIILLIISVLFTFGYEYFHHMWYQKD